MHVLIILLCSNLYVLFYIIVHRKIYSISGKTKCVMSVNEESIGKRKGKGREKQER